MRNRTSRSSHNNMAMWAALSALLGLLVVALSGVFMLGVSFMPWLDSEVSPVAETEDETSSVLVVGANAPARTVLTQVLRPRAGAMSGWDAKPVKDAVNTVSFGLGCSPTDVVAPALSRGRVFTTDGVRAEVSGSVFGAGAGAVAFEGAVRAADGCRGVSWVPVNGLGVEAVQVTSSRASTVMWRRGDVVMTGSVEGRTRLGEVFTAVEFYDRKLNRLLAGVCVNQEAGSGAVKRSPYVDRKGYKGLFQSVEVARPKQAPRFTAERMSDDPVVDIPAKDIGYPTVGDLPTPPTPAITVGPTALPDPVDEPVKPELLVDEPKRSTTVDRQVVDVQGPGCGWDFLGVPTPPVDVDAVEADHVVRVEKAQAALVVDWHKWQEARVVYFEEYDAYVKQAKKYRRYAKKALAVKKAWAVVEDARSRYMDALTVYEAEVKAFDKWVADVEDARRDWQANREACRKIDVGDSDAVLPSVINPSPSATPSPEDEVVCPAVRPDILGVPAPSVGPSPVPDAEAQLPVGDSPTED